MGAGQVHRFCPGDGEVSSGTCEPLMTAVGKAGMASCWSTNTDGSTVVGCVLQLSTDDTTIMVPLATPEFLRLPTATVSFTIAPARSDTVLLSSVVEVETQPASSARVDVGAKNVTQNRNRAAVATVTLESTDTAMYVTLTTEAQV